jgi:hypothetical protein
MDQVGVSAGVCPDHPIRFPIDEMHGDLIIDGNPAIDSPSADQVQEHRLSFRLR